MLRLLFPALALLAGCIGDVPHENPLDPLSADYRDEGILSGRVTGVYPPFDGRPNVSVRLTPLDIPGSDLLTRTDAAGLYTFRSLPSGRYEIRAEREGLRAGVDTVLVLPAAEVTVTIQVDALPVVTSQALRTVHIERWFPSTPVFQLEVDAEATDPDRASDVESAAIVARSIGFRAPLNEIRPGTFEARLDASILPDGRVQSLLGLQLQIEVTDRAGNVTLGPPMSLVRVIEQTPLTAAPQGLEVPATNPPVLEWRPADLPFPFTYRVDLFLVNPQGLLNLVESVSGILPTSVSRQLPSALQPGDYAWTVWVVDANGNKSRSREAGFRVL